MVEIDIFGTLNNATPEGVIAKAEQIKDATQGKKQSAINADYKQRIENLEKNGGGEGGCTIDDNPLADFSIEDDKGNSIAVFRNGHIKTKEFDSSDLQKVFFNEKDGTTKVVPVVNKEWEGWDDVRYSFGFTSKQTPLYNESFSITDGTIICSGDKSKMRWGYHVFEGYATDKRSRITMLVNKHNEEGRNLAEMYYYLTSYTHNNDAYGFFKIGSDVMQHSFMFSRDIAIAYGEFDFRNVIELASINLSEDIISTYDNIKDADKAYAGESNYENNAKCVLYLALKNSRDGAIWYDNQRHKIVVKINGKWHDVQTQECEEGIYNF